MNYENNERDVIIKTVREQITQNVSASMYFTRPSCSILITYQQNMYLLQLQKLLFVKKKQRSFFALFAYGWWEVENVVILVQKSHHPSSAVYSLHCVG